MKRLHFEYDMHLTYSEPAKTSHFTIKCMPQSTDRQRVEALDIRIEPADSMEEGRDSFGNRLIFGNVNRRPDVERSDDFDLKIAKTIYMIKLIKSVHECKCKLINCFGMQILICKLKFY